MKLTQQEGYAVRRVCAVLGLSSSSYYHKLTPSDDQRLCTAIEEIVSQFPMAQEVRWVEPQRTQAAQGARARERTAQEARGRFESGQADLAGSIGKKALKPARKRQLATEVIERHEISGRRACRLLLFHRSVFLYCSRKTDDRALRMRLRELAYARPRYGYRRLLVLLRREGCVNPPELLPGKRRQMAVAF